MKLISWNVNGLRACITKGFYDFFQQEDADMEEVLELEEMDAPMPEDVDPRGIKGEDFIDLLELKGFKEAVIVGGIVLISTVIFLIRRFL